MKRFAILAAAALLFAASPCASRSVHAATTARPANDFLNSLGINLHVDETSMTPSDYITQLSYLGVRNVRPGDQTRRTGSALVTFQNDLLYILNAVPYCKAIWSLGSLDSTVNFTTSNLQAWVSGAGPIISAGKLTAFEGANEPNSWPVQYNGVVGGGTGSWAAVAALQADLRAAAYAAYGGSIMVANISNVGWETDNVGLQMAQQYNGGTVTEFWDIANIHNYLDPPPYSTNWVWGAFTRTNAAPFTIWNDYGVTWAGGFPGYSEADLAALPYFVATETGWMSTDPNEDMQGRALLNLYLTGFATNFNVVYIYELEEQGDNLGIVYKSGSTWVRKKAATYIHNLTTILADTTSNPPGSLNYSISNRNAPIHDMLLQKSNGRFDVVVWDDRQTTTTRNITVNLGTLFGTVKVYDPTVGTAAVNTYSNVSSVSLAMKGHPLIVEPQ